MKPWVNKVMLTLTADDVDENNRVKDEPAERVISGDYDYVRLNGWYYKIEPILAKEIPDEVLLTPHCKVPDYKALDEGKGWAYKADRLKDANECGFDYITELLHIVHLSSFSTVQTAETLEMSRAGAQGQLGYCGISRGPVGGRRNTKLTPKLVHTLRLGWKPGGVTKEYLATFKKEHDLAGVADVGLYYALNGKTWPEIFMPTALAEHVAKQQEKRRRSLTRRRCNR